MAQKRLDSYGVHRLILERNKKKILATQDVCGICGKPVDKKLKWPDPMCAVIDHIVPVNKGGHPSDLNNLQLAHMCCNRIKSDKLFEKEILVVMQLFQIERCHRVLIGSNTVLKIKIT